MGDSIQLRVLRDDEVGPDLLAALRALLDLAFDHDFSEDDWQHTFGGHRVVVFEEHTPVSHAAVVPRHIRIGDDAFRTGYVEGVATHPARRGRGIGRSVMAEVASIVRNHYQLGALATGAHEFYRRRGWESWQGPSFVHHGSQLERTADEDDALMVLRFGQSVTIDLAAAIICETRPGDPW